MAEYKKQRRGPQLIKKAAVAILTFATVAVYLETMDQSVLTELRPIARFRLAAPDGSLLPPNGNKSQLGQKTKHFFRNSSNTSKYGLKVNFWAFAEALFRTAEGFYKTVETLFSFEKPFYKTAETLFSFEKPFYKTAETLFSFEKPFYKTVETLFSFE